MTEFAAYQGKVAGAALLLALLTYVVAIAIVAAKGEYAGFTAGLTGYEDIGDKVSGASATMNANTLAVILQVVGFGILTAKLNADGEAGLATASFGLLLLALTFFTLRVTFEGEVTAWGARLFARGREVIDLYEPLRLWMATAFGLFYVGYLVAGVGFGWGVLRAGLLAPWVGWLSIGWGLLWLVGALFQVGIPGLALIYPLIFGVGLLLY